MNRLQNQVNHLLCLLSSTVKIYNWELSTCAKSFPPHCTCRPYWYRFVISFSVSIPVVNEIQLIWEFTLVCRISLLRPCIIQFCISQHKQFIQTFFFQFLFSDLLHWIVSSDVTHRTYRNIYCALCNSESINDLVFLPLELECPNTQTGFEFSSHSPTPLTMTSGELTDGEQGAQQLDYYNRCVTTATLKVFNFLTK